ncbi:hypothetical protein WZ211_2741 [Enterococcus faecalis]|nr:hypothetical protein WZ211_2741 [Enterococcus faecalis]
MDLRIEMKENPFFYLIHKQMNSRKMQSHLSLFLQSANKKIKLELFT